MVTKDTRTAASQPPPAAADLPSGNEEDDLSIEYPSSDGEPMAESKLQYTPLTDTVSALENYFIDRNDVFIAGDLLVYYRMNDNRTRVAPDVFVVFGAAGNHPRDSWLAWREGKTPDFVMEIASPSTWERDAAEKREIYASMDVTEYWRFDPTGECFTPELVGETLAEGQYRALPLERDGEGRLWGRSAVLGLDIYALPGLELRLYHPADRRWLLTHRESEEARQAAVAAHLESEKGRQAAEAALQGTEEARQAAEAALQGTEEARQAAEAALQGTEEARQAAEAALQGTEEARQAAEADLQESEIARQQLEAENESLREQLRALQSGQ